MNSFLKNWRIILIDNKFLLDDKQIFEFIINGYMIFNPKFSADFNKTILQKADALEASRATQRAHYLI